MPVLKDMRSVSIWMKLSLVFVGLGIILFSFGFATEGWMGKSITPRTSLYVGLWNWKCRYFKCNHHDHHHGSASYDYDYTSNNNDSDGPPAFHKATQAMECLSLMGMCVGFLLLLFFNFCNPCHRSKVLMGIIFLITQAVFSTTLGFVVFAVNYGQVDYRIGWSMVVAITGTISLIIGGIMCFVHLVIPKPVIPDLPILPSYMLSESTSTVVPACLSTYIPYSSFTAKGASEHTPVPSMTPIPVPDSASTLTQPCLSGEVSCPLLEEKETSESNT